MKLCVYYFLRGHSASDAVPVLTYLHPPPNHTNSENYCERCRIHVSVAHTQDSQYKLGSVVIEDFSTGWYDGSGIQTHQQTVTQRHHPHITVFVVTLTTNVGYTT